jgi:hypothetical protein
MNREQDKVKKAKHQRNDHPSDHDVRCMLVFYLFVLVYQFTSLVHWFVRIPSLLAPMLTDYFPLPASGVKGSLRWH